MLYTIISLFAFVTLSLAAFGIGRPLLRWIGTPDDDRLATVTFSMGIGLTVAGLVLLLLGLAGALYVPLIGLLTMVACCWGLVEIGIACLRLEERLPDSLHCPSGELEQAVNPPWPAPPRWLLVGLLMAAALVGGASLLSALAPPASNAMLSCQLESAKRFLVEHRIVDLPMPESVARPLLVDMWYLWALALDSGVCAQLIHWGLGVLLVMATVTLGTPLLGRSWAWLAGCLVLLTPAINQQMSLPMESVALATFCTLALAAWWQAVIHGADRQWFVVAGLAVGGALGIHYSAGLLVLALAVTWAWAALHQVEQRHFLLHGGIIMGLIALAAGALCSLPMIRSATSVCLSSVEMSVATVPDHLGLILLAASPGILLTRRLRGLGAVVSAAIVYAAFVLLLSGNSRLLFPAVPLLSVAAVWVWIELPRFSRPARLLAAAAFGLMLACNITMSLVRSPEAFLVALGVEAREDYLLRHEPTYSAAAVANHLLRADAHILSQDRQSFYFDCRVTPDSAFSHAVDDALPVETVQETSERLRNAGFTHLLLVETASQEKGEASPSPLNRLADDMLPLSSSRFETADGSVRCYRLMALR